MAKYYKFNYTTGYVGTDTEVIFKFPDDWTDKDIARIFDEWYDEQRSDSGDYEELDQEDEDFNEDNFDDSYCD